MRFLEIRFFGRERRRLANPLATLILAPLVSAPQVLGVLFWNNFSSTVWCTLCMGLLFVFSYGLALKIAKKSRGLS